MNSSDFVHTNLRNYRKLSNFMEFWPPETTIIEFFKQFLENLKSGVCVSYFLENIGILNILQTLPKILLKDMLLKNGIKLMHFKKISQICFEKSERVIFILKNF